MKHMSIPAAFVSLLLPALASANSVTLSHPGRTLAANCFQCHGTDGSGLEHLAGKSRSSIANELLEMQFKPAGKQIMNVHAMAYTDEEIALIADYFSKQK
ncbi:MAG: cytochrome c class I [Candidatus Thiothrix singaporensis]|uniref:Cytochrome c class I n=1 Tax=Candidatus Thiothrix singaporensis TaxID=2799669 RepID=A0A7L6AU15_9GAMM|nr:MAG: cytochrome c class I [Candidatus Thiothrix singaporensis]